MNTGELLSMPHSALTRKQRRERARVKAQVGREMGLPAGFALGRVHVADPLPGEDPVARGRAVISRAAELGQLKPGQPGVMVRMLDAAPEYSVGRP